MANERKKTKHTEKGNNTDDEIRILQINSSNSKTESTDNRVKMAEAEVKITIISESNMDNTCQEQVLKRNKIPPNFRCKDKLSIGSNAARLSMLVHKDLVYLAYPCWCIKT